MVVWTRDLANYRGRESYPHLTEQETRAPERNEVIVPGFSILAMTNLEVCALSLLLCSNQV